MQEKFEPLKNDLLLRAAKGKIVKPPSLSMFPSTDFPCCRGDRRTTADMDNETRYTSPLRAPKHIVD